MTRQVPVLHVCTTSLKVASVRNVRSFLFVCSHIWQNFLPTLASVLLATSLIKSIFLSEKYISVVPVKIVKFKMSTLKRHISAARALFMLMPSHVLFEHTYQRGVFYSALNLHESLHLATAYRHFCTLCIWSLTKLLQTRLKALLSYISRTIIYVDAFHYHQNLNVSKIFGLEDR